MNFKNKYLLIIPIIILIIYGSFLACKINLITADLGRHIKNGEVVFNDTKILKANYYSYTSPDYPVNNHHWVAGVIFYLVWKTNGFYGLSVLFILLSVLTLCIFFYIAKEESSYGVAGLLALLIIPLLAKRTEIRPELFTYFFSSIFFLLLLKFKRDLISIRVLFILPFLEILWVNTHIYFLLGPFLIFCFLIEHVFNYGIKNKKVFLLFYIFLCTIFACLINPFFVSGLIAPFSIFKNYGYRIIENQSVFFIQRLVPDPSYGFFKTVFSLMIASYVIALVLRKKISIANLMLGLFMGISAYFAIRNFTVFGLVSLPVIASNINLIFGDKITSKNRIFNVCVIVILLFISILFFRGSFDKVLPQRKEFGIGLQYGNDFPARFFKGEKIQGPIFNNYDIGSYLIFYLFPEYKVFVDNRPEAYSVEFFKNIYMPMQEDYLIWKEYCDKYDFNAIFFSYRDATTWGQEFIIRIVQDPEWAPVFVDYYVLILVKRNELNKDIIKKYEIPKSRFKIVKIKF